MAELGAGFSVPCGAESKMSPGTFALAAALAALASPATAACDFDFSLQVRDRSVTPAAAKIGASPQTWDLDSPTVFVTGRDVKLLIELRDQTGLLDPPYLVVRIADCGHGRARARVEAWDVALGLRED